jgi:hypothetical protein
LTFYHVYGNILAYTNKNKQNKIMSLHLLHHHSQQTTHHIGFTPVDPLGDGLREDIIAEQSEPDAIVLEDRPDEGELVNYLESITSDIKSDTDEFTYSEE